MKKRKKMTASWLKSAVPLKETTPVRFVLERGTLTFVPQREESSFKPQLNEMAPSK